MIVIPAKQFFDEQEFNPINKEINGNTDGHEEYAKRIAMNKFDEWNNVTGQVAQFTGYYYEIEGLLHEVVEMAFDIAINGRQTK
jgi:hypothetical protein